MPSDKDHSDRNPAEKNKKPDPRPSRFTIDGAVYFGPKDLEAPDARHRAPGGQASSGDKDSEEDFEEDFDDDNDAIIVRDPAMFTLAEKFLPQRGEIALALELITNLWFQDLMTAIILEEHLRGYLPQARVDRMVAASILASAANYQDIADDFPDETQEIVDDYDTLFQTLTPRGPDMDLYAGICMDAQRVYIASIAADMEILGKEINFSYLPDRKEMYETANFLLVASLHLAKNLNSADHGLMLRTVTGFNRVAEIMKLKIDLVLSASDMTISIRDKTKPADPNHLKSKFDPKAQKPQPPSAPPKDKNKNKNKKKKGDDPKGGPKKGGLKKT